MENQNLNEAFKNLDTNEKRNEYNAEISKIYEILKVIISAKGYKEVKNLRNYDVEEDRNLTEDEFLAYEYQNILLFRDLLLTILATNDGDL